jgi:hypothetical protein
MKPREEVARFIEKQMEGRYVCSRDKGFAHHYGLQELRELMDFIYGGEPTESERIRRWSSRLDKLV